MTRRRAFTVAAVVLAAIVGLQVVLYLDGRVGKGAKAPSAAASAYVSALANRDRDAIDALTSPDIPDRPASIDTALELFAGFTSTDIQVKDTDSGGVKHVLAHGTLLGSPLDLSFFLTRTRNRWFVVSPKQAG